MKAGGSILETSRTPGEEQKEADLLAALPTRSANREVRLGAFVLVGVAAFLVSLFTLTDVGTFRGRYYTSTVIPHAGGMRNGDPVQMRGVNIGRVSGFTMVPNGVEVGLEIYNRYDVPEDSKVLIHSAGLLGGMIVDVLPGGSTERASREVILTGEVEQDMFDAAAGLSTQAEDVLGRANLLLSDSTISSVGVSATELQQLLTDLSSLAAAQRQELAILTQSLIRSAEGVERITAGPELTRSLAHVDSLTTRLNEATVSLTEASTALGGVMGRLERGEGTLGRLTTDETLYDNLNAAVTSLQDLVADIKREPGRYLNIDVF